MAPLTFRNEDEEAQYCLSALRDGTREEKIVARERLAAIFAGRGLFEEAAELYELNIRAGVRTPALFEQLSEMYRHLGDLESAEAALVEAGRLSEPESATLAQPEPSDRPRRTGPAVPGPLLVVGVVLFMIVLPVILLALLVVNPVGLYLEGRAAGPVVDVRSTEPPTLKVAPGMSATCYLQTGRSVSGLWATPGLELTLAHDAAESVGPFSVTAPRSQGWGETITIVERRGQGRANQETIVPATFQAPTDLPPAGTVLDGRIVGKVSAPRLTETSQFNTTTQNVDLSVRLVVVSGFDLWLDRFGNAVRMFFDEDRWLLVTIGAILTWCVLAGGAAILFRARQP